MVKWGCLVLVSLSLMFTSMFFYLSYLSAADIDETYSKGSVYGFVFGMPKEVVYDKLPENLSSMGDHQNMYFVFISISKGLAKYLGSTENSKLMVQTRFLPNKDIFFADKDEWKIYFKGSFNDYILFRFSENKLHEIRRFRQAIESP